MFDGENGRRLRLHSLQARGKDIDYVATLELPEGRASVTVYEYGTGLPAFVRSVADAWQGFTDVKEYVSLEGDLVLSCRHDGLATVECDVTVRQPSPPEWSMRAVLAFGAGAHFGRIADAVAEFFASAYMPIWPRVLYTIRAKRAHRPTPPPSHPATTVAAVTTCPGSLILHADGTVAGCTEDDEPTGCGAEHRSPHPSGHASCTTAVLRRWLEQAPRSVLTTYDRRYDPRPPKEQNSMRWCCSQLTAPVAGRVSRLASAPGLVASRGLVVAVTLGTPQCRLM